MEATQTFSGFREATTGDLERAAQLWLEMFQEVGLYGEADFAPDWRERFVAYCRSRMSAGELRYFVYEEDGEVLGCAGALVRDGLHASRFGRPIYERMGFVPTNEMELPP